jgi:hypothetical protein
MLDDQSIDGGFVDWPRHRPVALRVFTAELDAAGERYLKRKRGDRGDRPYSPNARLKRPR